VEYVFRHDLLRETAYGMLTEADRALGHKLAGVWLESKGEDEPVRLAEHFERGGDHGRAASFYRRAAERALAGNDLRACLEAAERAIGFGVTGSELGSLLTLQAIAHAELGGRAAESRSLAIRAVEALPRGSPSRYIALSHVHAAGLATGVTSDVSSIVDELREPVADPEAERTRLRTCAHMGWWLVAAGRRDQADQLVDQVAPYADSSDLALRAWVLRSLAQVAATSGDLAKGAELWMRAAECGGWTACYDRVNAGWASTELGAHAQAEPVLRAALAEAQRSGRARVAASARQALGLAVMRLGRVDEARALISEAAEAFAVQGDKRLEGCTRVYLSSALALRGDFMAAEAVAKRAVELLDGMQALRCYALAALAHAILGQEGRHAEALALAEEAHKLLVELGDIDVGDACVRLVYAEALGAVGRTDEARQARTAARDHLLRRAARIPRDDWRDGFLRGTPENARTLDLGSD
jgi:tetratricopeptide (TPR) repeat protein